MRPGQKQILFLSALFKIESHSKLSFMHSTKFPKKIIKRSEADVSPRASTKQKEIKKTHHHLFSTLAAGMSLSSQNR